MSDTETAELTVEQKAFLEECQVEFANRFSNEDPDYKLAFERGMSTPPLMSPWYGRPRLTAKRHGHRGYQGRQDRDYRGQDRDHYENRYSRNDRKEDGYRQYNPY